MDLVFEKRVGAHIFRSPFWRNIYMIGFSASRPVAKLSMFRDKLTIKILFKVFTIPYTDIDFLEKGFFKIIVHHHNASIAKYVFITNTGTCRVLFDRIKEVARNNNLPINFL